MPGFCKCPVGVKETKLPWFVWDSGNSWDTRLSIWKWGWDQLVTPSVQGLGKQNRPGWKPVAFGNRTHIQWVTKSISVTTEAHIQFCFFKPLKKILILMRFEGQGKALRGNMHLSWCLNVVEVLSKKDKHSNWKKLWKQMSRKVLDKCQDEWARVVSVSGVQEGEIQNKVRKIG